MHGFIRLGNLLAVTGVLGSTVGTSLLIGPLSSHSPAHSPSVAVTLPLTGGNLRSRAANQGTDQQPVAVYSLDIPPAPPAPPAPAPAPAAHAPAVPRHAAAPVAQPWSVTIGVPIYRQAMTLDCETSAMRMGLATFGHYYSDSALFAYENVDSRGPVMGPNHTVAQWGDPYTNFVGNVWGSDWTPTGYGVYYPVIVSIAQSHGLPATYGGEGFAPSTVYAALAAHHPVEVWIETNWSRPWMGTWTAWDGRRIRYSYVEHAVILSGVSATMIRVNDPLHGTQYWVSKRTFETVWRDFNDMAVIFQ
jgi:uncharacterized protein YvpB